MQTGDRKSERGALLPAMATLVAILSIFSLIGFQKYEDVLQRDKEAEMIFRAEEIVRAIQRYRLDRGGQAPLKFEDLAEPGSKGQYFIRKLYEDPLVKDGKWGLLFVGPGNQIIDPNADEEDLAQAQGLGGSGLGAFGQGQRPGDAGKNQGLSGPGNNRNRPEFGKNKANRQRRRQSGLSSLGQNSAFGGGETTGLPIAGVRTLSEDEPFRERNGLKEYSEWQFTYFDLENQQLPGQRGRPGQGARGNRRPGQNPNTNTTPGNSGLNKPGARR